MAKKYALVSTRGGIGKTTVTANLGGILADTGQKVLIIDADHQQSLSNYYPTKQAANGLLRSVDTQTAAYNSRTPSAHDTMLALVHELLPHLLDVVPEWNTVTNNTKQGLPNIG